MVLDNQLATRSNDRHFHILFCILSVPVVIFIKSKWSILAKCIKRQHVIIDSDNDLVSKGDNPLPGPFGNQVALHLMHIQASISYCFNVSCGMCRLWSGKAISGLPMFALRWHPASVLATNFVSLVKDKGFHVRSNHQQIIIKSLI